MAEFATVVIPNWNGRPHLADCLDALAGQTAVDFEVIVVDNGSGDGSQSFIRDNYPWVRLLELGENRGFTFACNAGYAVAKGEYILLLNNDTAPEPGWIAAIVDAFQRRPDVGVVASKILLFDQRDIFHTAGDFYRQDGIPGNRGVWRKDEGQFDCEEAVFGACGGAAGYRRSMIAQIGFLDDAFVFSCEDVDLSWRAHLAGWLVLYVPKAVVYHKLKASGGSGAFSSFYDGRNTLYVLWKNYPDGLWRRHWKSILEAQLAISCDALRAWRGEAARARLRGQVAGFLGLPAMWSRRRQIQSQRVISDSQVNAMLTAIDESIADR